MTRLLLLILFTLPSICLAQTSEEVRKKYSSLGLPLICITTVGGEEPTSTNVMHPDGSYVGASITNIVPKNGRIQIYRSDTLWYDSGEYQDQVSGMTIKHRGNTSAYHYANKPFKLTLEKKADLIITPEDDDTDRRSKHWVLLNCSFSVRTAFIYWLEKMIGMEFTPRIEYVNVIVNNDYRGLYILSENVRRDKDCRIDVDKDEGYIIELNAYFWNEPFSIPSRLIDFMQWTPKYPDPEDLTEEQEANIRSDIERLETSVADGNYSEVIDVRSVARWILLHDLLGTYDAAGSNIFVVRKNTEPSSLMRMPVGWDMDSSMRYPEKWSRTHTERGIFISRLFANELCTDFIETYLEEWSRVSEAGIMERMRQLALAFPSSALGQGLKRSYPLHAKRWGYDVSIFDVDMQAQLVYNWFVNREPGLNGLISGLAVGIEDVEAEKETGARKVILGKHLYIIRDNKAYSIDGMRTE